MSAIACHIRELEVGDSDLHDTTYFSRGVKAEAERRCPHCNSVVYSRRHKLCGVCAEPLPDACLFSEAQAQNVRSLVDEERARHRVWLQKFWS
jgi:hypothetical protein